MNLRNARGFLAIYNPLSFHPVRRQQQYIITDAGRVYVTCDCTAGTQNTPSDTRCSGPAWPSRKPVCPWNMPRTCPYCQTSCKTCQSVIASHGVRRVCDCIPEVVLFAQDHVRLSVQRGPYFSQPTAATSAHQTVLVPKQVQRLEQKPENRSENVRWAIVFFRPEKRRGGVEREKEQDFFFSFCAWR